jgi:hypothetical protein
MVQATRNTTEILDRLVALGAFEKQPDDKQKERRSAAFLGEF